VGTSPLNGRDPTGLWWETPLDILSLYADLLDVATNGLNWTNGIAIGADIVGLALPVVGGLGFAIRGVAHAGDAVTIYRGTRIWHEIEIADETGLLMSDAARIGYSESRRAGSGISEAIVQGRLASGAAHDVHLASWGSADWYVQAHGEFGHQISMIAPRSLISFTTDPNVAAHYAGAGGRIFSITVPRSSLIFQTLPGAGEAEVLVKHMIRWR
jgi:hypothetical protein